MKKMILVLVLSCHALSQVHAQTENGDDPGTPKRLSAWYLGIGLGITAPLQDWDPSFTLGGGGILFAGYQLDSLVAIQADLNPWFYTGGGNSIYDYRTSLDLRFNIQSRGMTTYLFLGPGYDVQVGNPSGYSTSSLAAVAGLGFQFDLHPGERLFLEGRYDLSFYNNLTQQDLPILFGLNEDL